jgi:hypothetical protein
LQGIEAFAAASRSKTWVRQVYIRDVHGGDKDETAKKVKTKTKDDDRANAIGTMPKRTTKSNAFKPPHDDFSQRLGEGIVEANGCEPAVLHPENEDNG